MKKTLYITILMTGIILAGCQVYAIKQIAAENKADTTQFDVENVKSELNAQCLAFKKSANRQIQDMDKKISKLRARRQKIVISPVNETSTKKVENFKKEIAESQFEMAA